MIFVQNCWLLVQLGSHMFWAPTAAKQPAVPVVTPEDLARQALATVQVPAPGMGMWPSDHDDRAGGLRITWVNAWTSVWASRQSWRPLSATASLGAVWARVRLTPTVLVFRPGDGQPVPPCQGPGRAWTPAPGAQMPPAGVCAYRYRSVSGGLTARLMIRWAASWTGSGGSGGQLGLLTSQTATHLGVEQIQAVGNG